jgi:hypothetical protein
MSINKHLIFPALFFSIVSTHAIYADGKSYCSNYFNNILSSGNWQTCQAKAGLTNVSLQRMTSSSLQGAQVGRLTIPSYLANNVNVVNFFQQHSIHMQIKTYQCTATANTYIRWNNGPYSKSITWNLCVDNLNNVSKDSILNYCLMTKSTFDPNDGINCLKSLGMDNKFTYVLDNGAAPACDSSFSSPPAYCQQNAHLYYCYSGSDQTNVVEIDGKRSWTASGHGAACHDLLPSS